MEQFARWPLVLEDAIRNCETEESTCNRRKVKTNDKAKAPRSEK